MSATGREDIHRGDTLGSIYDNRFSDAEAGRKTAMWREIGAFLQRYIAPDDAVLDLACDRGDFIRNIAAAERWGADLRDVRRHLPPDVTFVQADGLAIADHVPNEHFDVVFMSNYLEHLPSSDAVVDQMRAVRAVLKAGGRAIVLQPNIRYVGGRYWDFIDHHVALTERSLAEAADIGGLTPIEMIPRFLPYTTKSKLPQSPALVRAYLSFRPAWRLLGKQTLMVAQRA
jgi:SAM-dependent methyltransferase